MLKYYFLLLLFPIYSLNAQNSLEDIELHTNLDGIDAYPVYKATNKNSFIDSIVYAGPFIVFCVSFHKPTSDKIYQLHSPQSDQSWTCHNYRATHRPIQISNIQCNNKLVANKLEEGTLDVVFDQYHSTNADVTKISCEFLFWRSEFNKGKAILSQSFKEQKTIEEARNSLEFKDIRFRKSNFTRPLSTALEDQYIRNHSWNFNDLSDNIVITVNDNPIDHSKLKDASQAAHPQQKSFAYFVSADSHTRLYLDKITTTDQHTIFSVRYYLYKYSTSTLHNVNPYKYYFQHNAKKFKMNTIKAVCLNGKLITDEIKDKSSLRISNINAAAVLTFDIYFDKLPEDIKEIDLIEGKRIKRTFPFNFFKVQL